MGWGHGLGPWVGAVGWGRGLGPGWDHGFGQCGSVCIKSDWPAASAVYHCGSLLYYRSMVDTLTFVMQTSAWHMVLGCVSDYVKSDQPALTLSKGIVS